MLNAVPVTASTICTMTNYGLVAINTGLVSFKNLLQLIAGKAVIVFHNFYDISPSPDKGVRSSFGYFLSSRLNGKRGPAKRRPPRRQPCASVATIDLP